MSDSFAAPWPGRGEPRKTWAMSSAEEPSGATQARDETREGRGGGRRGHDHSERRQRRQDKHEQRRAQRDAARTMAMQERGMDPEVIEAIETLRRARRTGGMGRRGGHGGWGPGGGRRGRARRGDVRAAILTLLAEEPRNGYGVIQEIEERSGGVWKPSPGAVYPALQQLEDEGLVAPAEVDGRKVFALTTSGREYVEQNLADAPTPWASVAEEAGTSYRDAKAQIGQLMEAYAAVHRSGTPEQAKAATKILSDARRALYRILAEDEDETARGTEE